MLAVTGGNLSLRRLTRPNAQPKATPPPRTVMKTHEPPSKSSWTSSPVSVQKGKEEEDAQTRVSIKPPLQTNQNQVRAKKAEKGKQWGAMRGNVLRSTEGAKKGASTNIVIQRKMTVGPVGDKYELEADRVAAQVVKTIQRPVAKEPVRREEREEGDEVRMRVQRSAASHRGDARDVEVRGMHRRVAGTNIGAEGGPLSAEQEEAVKSQKGSGQTLDKDIAQKFGSAMGRDFSGVKVHTGGEADVLTRQLQAKAVTTGEDVFFRQGEYAPNTAVGQKLIAHELMHVVQQGSRGDAQKTVQREFTGDLKGKTPIEVFESLRNMYGEENVKAIIIARLAGLKKKKKPYATLNAIAKELGLEALPPTEEPMDEKEQQLPEVTTDPKAPPEPEPGLSVSELKEEKVEEEAPKRHKKGGTKKKAAVSNLIKKIEGTEPKQKPRRRQNKSPKKAEKLELINFPNLRKPQTAKPVFLKRPPASFKARLGGELIQLHAGQNFLNTHKSEEYRTGDVSAIKKGPIKLFKPLGNKGNTGYVVADAHHRLIWLTYHEKEVKGVRYDKKYAPIFPWYDMYYRVLKK